MRSYKFRGRDFYSGVWRYGYLTEYNTFSASILWQDTITGNKHTSQVVPSSVGQFTGVCDDRNKEIYEGDICVFHNSMRKDVECKIIYHSRLAQFLGVPLDKNIHALYELNASVEVKPI